MADAKKTVLIAMDESPHSAQAFQWYIQELHKPEHRVLILGVVEVTHVDMIGVYPAMVPQGTAWREQFTKKKQHLTEFLQRLLEKSHCKELDIKMKVLEGGRPGEVIVEEAQELKASLVVMGTRGLGTLRRTILGSVSDYVIHHAHCPVLVHRPPAETH